MKALIIEDDPNKLERIAEYLSSLYHLEPLEREDSYNGGISRLIEKHEEYSFVILDMTLPIFKGSRIDRGGKTLPFAGRDLLQQMKRRRLTGKVVVVTQYEAFGEGDEKKTIKELRDMLERDYWGIYFGLVYYNATLDSWKSELAAVLAAAIEN